MKIKYGIALLCMSFNICCLNSRDIKKIGYAIWYNETSLRKEQLAFWSEHESFPSFGIGHAIWFPEGVTSPFTEQFPLLCSYLEKNNVKLPLWLKKAKTTGAPWQSRIEFMQDTQKRAELIGLLSSTIDLQTRFMIERFEKRVPLLLKAVPPKKKKQVVENIRLLKSSLLGMYGLIDYLNFKGDGLNPQEEVHGYRWGLAQVLIDMPAGLTCDNVARAFSVSAAKRLLKLIENSYPSYARVKYLSGWMKRVNSYSDPEVFNQFSLK